MPGLAVKSPSSQAYTPYRGRTEATARSTASRTRTTGRGRLSPRAQHPNKLGRYARMPAAGTERPCRARQTCRGCGYSGKGRREARGHFPPPRQAALDALGLRRGAGCSPGWRKERSRRSPQSASNAVESCYNGSCSYLVVQVKGTTARGCGTRDAMALSANYSAHDRKFPLRPPWRRGGRDAKGPDLFRSGPLCFLFQITIFLYFSRCNTFPVIAT